MTFAGFGHTEGKRNGEKRKNEEKRTAVHPNTGGLVHLRLVFACLSVAGMSGGTKSYGVRVAIDQRRSADIVLAGSYLKQSW